MIVSDNECRLLDNFYLTKLNRFRDTNFVITT